MVRIRGGEPVAGVLVVDTQRGEPVIVNGETVLEPVPVCPVRVVHAGNPVETSEGIGRGDQPDLLAELLIEAVAADDKAQGIPVGDFPFPQSGKICPADTL